MFEDNGVPRFEILPQPPSRCTVSAFNRTSNLIHKGGFIIRNVPADQGLFRVRVTCSQGGVLTQGQTAIFAPVANGITVVGIPGLGPVTPIPSFVSVSASSTSLATTGATSQLTVTGTFPDASTGDLTSQSSGTSFTTSNPAIATVSPGGLVTAVSSGTAVISARNEGVLSTVFITVAVGNDADNDGLPDDFELANGLNPNDPSDALLDPDADGLTNLQEFQTGTSPFVADTDGDGLSDGAEVAQGTNPLEPDSDLDGLLDGDEIALGTNPLNADTDGDGLPDGVEVRIGLDPLSTDSDGDGLTDDLEDSDGDGLANIDELGLFTDPANPDTDGDGLLDGEEVALGEDPLVPETVPPTATVSNPLDGSNVVEGQTITVAIDATDNGRIDSVEISVNGTIFATDVRAPYELLFTVPSGVSTLTFGATVRDVAGNVATASDVMVSVIPDPLTTVEGTVVDLDGNPVGGADVAVKLNGLQGEFFNFGTPLSSLPDLTGLTPDVVKLVSAVNFRNPNNLFGGDTFGIGFAIDYAARFTGSIEIPAPGNYTFTLGSDDGARLTLNGIIVTEVVGSGTFTEASGTISLAAAKVPIVIEYFQAVGAAELQLSFSSITATGDERQVVPPSLLIQPADPLTDVTGVGGSFSIANVPTALGNLRVSAAGTVNTQTLTGTSGVVPPVLGGVTNVGSVVLGKVVFASVALGFQHTCAVTSAGQAFCWGDNLSGKLGDGTRTSRLTPVLVTGNLTFTSVSAGSNHTCGLTTSGEAYCWGSRGIGQLGDGSFTFLSTTPVQVLGGLTFSSIDAGNSHTCGVTTSGEAYCWGVNSSGQLGNGSTTISAVPVLVLGDLTFASISAGNSHTCGITTNGEAFCWGDNSAAQLGDGSAINSSTPVPVTGGLTFASNSAGTFFSCGVTISGQAFCWGQNLFGQLGDGSNAGRLTPVPVTGGLTFASLNASMGGSHSCGLTTSREAYCWGGNPSGQLGNGVRFDANAPVLVVGGLVFDSIAVGSRHSCGITTSGEVFCWGNNLFGQLGDGSTTDSSAPVRVTDP